MAGLIDGIARKIGGGDTDKGFRVVLIVGLLAIIIGCVTGMVMYISGGRASPTEVHMWCIQQQKEIILPFEDFQEGEDDWVESEGDSEYIRHVNPETGKRTLVPMLRCPACKAWYLPDALKHGRPTGKIGRTCPICGEDPAERYRKRANRD